MHLNPHQLLWYARYSLVTLVVSLVGLPGMTLFLDFDVSYYDIRLETPPSTLRDAPMPEELPVLVLGLLIFHLFPSFSICFFAFTQPRVILPDWKGTLKLLFHVLTTALVALVFVQHALVSFLVLFPEAGVELHRFMVRLALIAFMLFSVVLGLAATLFGLGAVQNSALPRWLGQSLLVLGLATVVLSIIGTNPDLPIYSLSMNIMPSVLGYVLVILYLFLGVRAGSEEPTTTASR